MDIQERPSRPSYPSDLTDEEWDIIADLVPGPIWIPNLQEPKHHPREVLNAIRYRTRTGCSWRQLPHDFPPHDTIYGWYARWTREGVLDDIHDHLRRMARVKAGRKPEPTAAIVDSQSVKSTDVGGPTGFDAGKKGERPQATSAGRRHGLHPCRYDYTSVRARS